VHHLTNGGGGAPLYTPASGQPYVVKVESTYSYVELDVRDATLVMTARRANGTVIESITVTHAATGNQPPIASAGPNQSVVDADGNGSESIVLDGSASNDPDGTIAGYTWKEGPPPSPRGPPSPSTSRSASTTSRSPSRTTRARPARTPSSSP
jgi:hypothetical protein